jgi:hypothetical protein
MVDIAAVGREHLERTSLEETLGYIQRGKMRFPMFK